jgi:hypothetical protein
MPPKIYSYTCAECTRGQASDINSSILLGVIDRMKWEISIGRLAGAFVVCSFGLALVGCSYTAAGDSPSASGQSAWPGEFVGLEHFDAPVHVVTFACGAHKFKLGFRDNARSRISTAMANAGFPSAGGSTVVRIEGVTATVGCHPSGFMDSRTFCRADVAVELKVVSTDAKGRSKSASARQEASGRKPLGMSLENCTAAINTAIAEATDAAASAIVSQLRA